MGLKQKQLIVCGDRHYPHYRTIETALKRERALIDLVIAGEARGADTMARMASRVLRIPFHPMPADWDTYSNFAGPVRNGWMRAKLMEFPGEKEVWAFHTHYQYSKGTRDMVEKALKWGLTTRLYETKEGDFTSLISRDTINLCPFCGRPKASPGMLAYRIKCKADYHKEVSSPLPPVSHVLL